MKHLLRSGLTLLFLATSLETASAQTTSAERRQPLPGLAPDTAHPLYVPANAARVSQTNYVLDSRPRGWAAILVSRELANGKAASPDQATGLAIYRQIGGDQPPSRMLSNVRLSRAYIPFDSPGLEPSISEEAKQEGMQPAKMMNVVFRCGNDKPCIKVTVWLGYPDPEDESGLQDRVIIEVSPQGKDAQALIDQWRKK